MPFNKALIQKDRGGFRNGPWNGFFVGTGGARRYFQAHLHFHKNGSVDGTGQDQVGKMKIKDGLFTMKADPNTFKARFKWLETKWEMNVSGVLDKATGAVTGTFAFNGGAGKFSMQPTISAIGVTPPGVVGSTISSRSASLSQPPQPTQPTQPTQSTNRNTKPSSQRSPQNATRSHQASMQPRARLAEPEAATNDTQSIQTLIEMGFEKRLCELAVNNAGTLEAQIEWIYANQDRDPEDLQQAMGQDPEAIVAQSEEVPHTSLDQECAELGFNAPPELLEQLTALGFTNVVAAAALLLHNNSVSGAADWLLSTTEQDQQMAILAIRRRMERMRMSHDAAAPSRHRPPARPSAALIMELMEITQCTDEHRAAEVLMRNNNDLSLATDAFFEEGEQEAAAPPERQTSDDLFDNFMSTPAPAAGQGNLSRTPQRKQQTQPQKLSFDDDWDDGVVLSRNRKNSETAGDDWFGLPSLATAEASGSSPPPEFDDLFSNNPAAVIPPPARNPLVVNNSSLAAENVSTLSDDDMKAPPKRSAPAPPKRSAPPPPAPLTPSSVTAPSMAGLNSSTDLTLTPMVNSQLATPDTSNANNLRPVPFAVPASETKMPPNTSANEDMFAQAFVPPQDLFSDAPSRPDQEEDQKPSLKVQDDPFGTDMFAAQDTSSRAGGILDQTLPAFETPSDPFPAPTDAFPASTDAFAASTDAFAATTDAFSAPTDAFSAPTDAFSAPTDPFPASADAFQASNTAFGAPVDGSPAADDAFGADVFGAPSEPFPAPTNAFEAPSDSFPTSSDAFPAPTDRFPAPTDAFPAPTGTFAASADPFPAPSDSFAAPRDAFADGFSASTDPFPTPSDAFATPSEAFAPTQGSDPFPASGGDMFGDSSNAFGAANDPFPAIDASFGMPGKDTAPTPANANPTSTNANANTNASSMDDFFS